jgi:hypothetical protein
MTPRPTAACAAPRGAASLLDAGAHRRVRISADVAALFFLLPLYVMLVTSVKPMSEIRLGTLLALPRISRWNPGAAAWQSACTGLECEGIRVGFWNSVRHRRAEHGVLSIAIGAVNGYALSFWRPRGAGLLFGVLMMGAFIPVQVMVYPLVRVLASGHLFSSLPGHRRDSYDLRHADHDAAVPQLLRGDSAGTVQGRAHRRRRFLAHLPAVDAADVDAGDRGGDHHAGDGHLERLPARPCVCRHRKTCR